MLEKRVRLPKLFCVMLTISAFTFGGGFVIVTLMKRKLVDELHWIDEGEMLDYAAMAQSCPGAIAVNAAILVGWRVAGLAGMLTALVATVLPPLVILSAISFFYAAFAQNTLVAAALGGMQAGVAAVICDVVLNLGKNVIKGRDALSIVLMLAAFALTFFARVNVIYVILGAAAIGFARALFERRKEGRHAA